MDCNSIREKLKNLKAYCGWNYANNDNYQNNTESENVTKVSLQAVSKAEQS